MKRGALPNIIVNLGEAHRNIPAELVLGLPRDPPATTFAIHGNQATQSTQEEDGEKGREEKDGKEEDGEKSREEKEEDEQEDSEKNCQEKGGEESRKEKASQKDGEEKSREEASQKEAG